MVDFEKSFANGLQAAAEASAKIAEINLVFDDLNQQLHAASDGKIKILRKTRSNNLLTAMMGIGSIRSKPPLETKADETTYLVAVNPLAKNSNESDIAVWSVDSRGYPCQIKFSGENFFCEDKAALEKILALMLSEPEIGQVFQRLINLPTNQQS